MKKIKVSILALSVLVGGAVFASAATTVTYIPYSLTVDYTNASDAVWSVDGGPGTTGTALPQVESGIVAQTDGSGKITGGGPLSFVYSTSNAFPRTIVWVQVTGKISNKTAGSAPTVTLALKGNGGTADGAGGAVPAGATLKFTGTVGADPSNTNNQVIVGTLSGNIKGATPLDPKNAKLTVANAFIEGSFSEFLDVSGVVLQSATKGVTTKMQFFSTDILGNGTIKAGAYKLTATGVGMSKGIKGTLTGTMGNYTNDAIAPSTNPIVFIAPTTGSLTATASGQKVTGTGPSFINAGLIP